jgi:autotransporter-associated beta strand protein
LIDNQGGSLREAAIFQHAVERGNGGTLDNTSGGAITLTNNNSQNWNADVSFLGTNALNMGTGAVAMNATRIVTVTSNTLTVGGVISGSGFGLTKAGSGSLVLSGANTYDGSTTINDGTLQIGNGSTTGSLSTSSAITNNGTLAFNRSTTITQGTDFNSVISGTGSLIQAGSGNLILTGANTYDGSTTINDGTLQIGNGSTTGSLSTSSAITNNGTLAFNRSNTITQGTDFNSVISGTGSVVQAGSGTLILSGANTYSGGTTLNAGQLNINNATAIGTGTLTLNGGTLDNTSAGAITLSNSNAQNWNADVSFLGTNALNMGTGAVAMNATRAVTVGSSNLTVGGVISGTGFGLTKAGSGTLILSGANTYTGATQVNGGTLTLSGGLNNSSVTVNGGVLNQTSTGSISGTGTTFILTSGNATLAGANTYTGATTITAGTLSISSDANLSGTNSALVFNGGTLQITGNALTSLNAARSTTFTAAKAIGFNIADAANTFTVSQALAQTTGGLTKSGNGTLNLTSSGNTYTGTTTIAQGALALGAGASLGNLGGSDIVLGGTSASAGSTATLTIDPTAAVFLDAAVTYSANAGSDNLGATISGGTILLNSTSRIFSVADSAAAVDLTVSSVLGNGTAASAVIKHGAGTMLLSGVNTYTGSTTIQGGTLLAGGNVAVSTGGVFGNSSGSINLGRSSVTTAGENVALLTNGAFTIARGVSVATGLSGTTAFTSTLGGNTANTSEFSGQIAAGKDLVISQVAGGTLNITGGITSSSTSTRTITFAGPGAINVSTGGISDGSGGAAASVNVTGGNTTFSNANTYTGATTISAGTLQIGNGGTTGSLSTSSAITNNGTLAFNRSDTITQGTNFNSAISGTGSLIQAGSGNLILTGANTYTGATTISAGTLQIGNGTTIGSLSASSAITNNGTLAFNRSNDLAQGTDFSSAAITGTGSLIKNGAGNLTLNAANTYSGATTINAGVLVLNGTNSASAITVNTGGTLAGSGTGGATTVNSGGKIGPGNSAGNSPGTLTVGDLTLNGGGIYSWEMADATAAAGTGWDQINTTGLLTIGANATSPFTIAITSSGAPSNWNFSTTNQSWDIIRYGTTSGFNSSWFTLNSTAFAGDLSPDSTWSLTDTGSALRLTYAYTASAPTYGGGTGNWSTGFNPAISNSANVTFVGAGGVATNDIASGTLSTLGSLTFDGSNSYTLQANAGSAGSTSALAITGNITNNSTATQTINLTTSYAASKTINANTGNFVIGGNMSIGNGASLTVLGSNSTTISGAISGLGGLTKNGTGALTLSGSNTYSGGTSLLAGEVVIASASAISTASTLSTSGGTLSTSLASITLSNNINVNSNVIVGTNTNTGNFILSGTLNANNVSRTITVTNAATTVDITGVIAKNGQVTTYTKAGNGTLILSGGSNTWDGGLTLTAGTLQLNNANNGGLGTGGNLTLNGGTLQALNGNRTVSNTVNLGVSSTISGSQDLALNGTMSGSTVNSKTLTNNIDSGKKLTLGNININSVNATPTGLTIAGTGDTLITGVVANGNANANTFTITNTGTTTLSGSNTYTGATTISAGTLQIGNGGTTGSLSTSSSIVNNSALAFNRSDTITQGTDFANSISGTGNLTQAGTGNLVLTAANTYSGSTTISAGAMNIQNASALGTTAAGTTVASGAALQLQGGISVGAEALTLSGNGVSSTGALRNISGTNSYAGAITLNAATRINSDSGTLNLSGGIGGAGQNLTVGGSGNTTINSAIATTIGSLTKDGSGTVTLASANSYTGGTTINSGTLQAAATGALANTSQVVLNEGGSFLVTADNAVNDSAAINLNGGRMAVNGNFDETVGLLTLSANSTLDFSGFAGTLRFGGIGSWATGATLAIWNWSGTTQYGTQVNNYATPSNLVFTNNSTLTSNLANISFYSDSGNSFVGNGFDRGFSGGGTEIIAVPEPEAFFYAVVLLAGLGVQYIRRGAKRKLLKGQTAP